MIADCVMYSVGSYRFRKC